MLIDFLIQLPIFLAVCFFFFYVPGALLVKRVSLQLTTFETTILSFVLGMILVTIGTYIFGFLQIRWIVPLILVMLSYLFFKEKPYLPTVNMSKIKSYWPEILVIFLGTSVFTLMVAGSGWETQSGMQFIGVNARDGIWHTALVNGLASRLPPEHPFLSDVPLKGYHYFFDLLLSEIVSLTPISTTNLLFRFFPILISVLWGGAIYIFVRNWLSRQTALWATLWTYFGGSFSYLLLFAKRRNFSLDDSFGILQPATSLINPPFAISVVILMTGFWILHKYLKTSDKSFEIPIILLFGSLVGFKVHAGIIGLGALVFTLLWVTLRTKKFFHLRIVVLSLFTAVLIYLPNIGMTGFLSFAPMALIQQIMASSGINWQTWELQRQSSLSRSDLVKLFTLEIIGLVIFIIGNLGTRIIGFAKIVPIIGNIHKKDNFSLFFLSAISISVLVPLLFLQPVNPYDIVQMGWYFLLFFAIMGSWAWIEFINKIKEKHVKYFLFSLLFLLTLPSAIEKINIYAFGNASKKLIVDKRTLNAIFFLQKNKNKNKIILELPKFLEKEQSPAVIKANIAFSPIIALTGLRSYFGEEVQGYNFPQTKEKLEIIMQILDPLIKKCDEPSFFVESDCRQIGRNALAALGKTNIELVYSEFKIPWFKTADEIKEIYYQDNIIIYEFRRK